MWKNLKSQVHFYISHMYKYTTLFYISYENYFALNGMFVFLLL